ncbi:UvrD-helicase domain-containing protein [Acetobacter sp. TBRC 12305]|uniref:DNA 3'-5' helicase n=1 Tax=Acetobacter garciniae TaxID=2817435 RepID=A0A939KNC1_9PROT|nr:UvrD-helicase domain-containing protein [Acetobacter garciniae]MBO1326213.1 UvrD-helicase domain-containing protein [Acetobacter garciniae]MBX0346050.1 UvrD-helicase domain-containing protein [Acetobacter garciniae]
MPISSVEPDAAIAELTRVQREAASLEGPVVVLAGAGTGKTKTLVAGVVDRIERRGISPHRILAVTFTNKAAEEMRERIGRALGPGRTPQWLGTFHAHGRRQLRIDPDIASLRDGFDVCDAEDSRRIVRRLLQRATDEGALDRADGDTFRKRVKSVTSRIAMFKDDLVAPHDAQAAVERFTGRFGARDAEDVMAWHMAAALYPAYQAALREANHADFGDLLLWPTLAMLRDEAYRRDWAGRFDAVLADEFQDVNRLQFLWLQLLSRDHRQIFAVGDDAQSIYGWRGANVGFIRNFSAEFPGARMVALEQNFRSTGHILNAANAVIAQDTGRLEKTLFTAEGPGEKIEVLEFSSGQDEAQGLAREIGRRQLEGVRLEDMAILYRFNFMSRLLEEELLRAKIPYELVNDTAFWQRAVIKDALALLRLADCPDDTQSDEAFRRVVNQPARGVGAKSLAKIEHRAETALLSLFAATEELYATANSRTAERVGAFLRVIREEQLSGATNLAERIRSLLDRTGYLEMHRAAGEEGRAALENLEELITLAGDFTSIEDLFDHAALGSAAVGQSSAGRIRLMTIHGSKGLEYSHVFLMGWEDTQFPSLTNPDQDEERRLAYVALTRARRRAAISWCGWRNGRAAGPSPFLHDILPASLCRGWLRAPRKGAPVRHRVSDEEARACFGW